MPRADRPVITSRRLLTAILLAFLLVIFATELVLTVRTQSLTWDEGDHIFAGYMSWKTADFGLNPEHPPLVKLVATLPLLHLRLNVPPLQHRFFKDESYLDGRELLFHSPPFTPQDLTLRVRMAAAVFSLLLAAIVFLVTRELFGTNPAFLALVLLIFEPNLIAHGAYVTTDIAVSCFLFAAVFCFYRYLLRPTPARLLVAGLVSGLALASKHSAILLFPILLLLAIGELLLTERVRRRPPIEHAPFPEPRRILLLRLGGSLLAISIISVLVLWAFYGFRYNARPSGLRLDPSLAAYVHPLKPIEASGILLAAHLHLLPESYLYGLADVRAMASGMPSYIFGRIYEHGVWFYFPSVLLIKSTLGFLALVLLALAAIATGRLRRPREVLFLTLPPAFYLLVAITSSLNIGARHILPVYVFLCVIAAGGSFALTRRHRFWSYIVGFFLVLHVGSSLRAFPLSLSYSNELWGGPSKTYRYLTDSSVDWGQQLLATKQYADAHHLTTPESCWIAYFAAPFLLPSDYGIPCRRLPTFDEESLHEVLPVPDTITGPVFLSAGDLTGYEYGVAALNPYQSFAGRQPDAFLQNGMFVFTGVFHLPLAAASSHVQQATLDLAAGRLDNARTEAEASVQVASDALTTHLLLASVLAAQGHPAEAHMQYTRALALASNLDPDARSIWTARIHTAEAAGGPSSHQPQP